MSKKHLNRSVLDAYTKEESRFIGNDALPEEIDIEHTGNETKVILSIKYLQNGHQCFSDWSKVEMGKFWDFNKKLHNMTWRDVYSSARKKEKTGMAFTKIPINNYPKSTFRSELSADITLFELRVDDCIRVHGFRDKRIFFMCWLDKDHIICN